MTVGGIPAIGESFNAAQCQGERDTYGWFAGVNQYGTDFLFYVFIDPVQAYNGARGQVQQILDTVVFHPAAPGNSTPATLGAPPTNTPSGGPPTTTPVLQ